MVSQSAVVRRDGQAIRDVFPESDDIPLIDTEEAPKEVVPPYTPVKRKYTPLKAPVMARWATETEVEEDLKNKFESLSLEEALSLLVRMRHNCETAAKIIERRRCEETDKTACLTCGVTRKQLGSRNWRMVRPRRDQSTGTLVTEYFCSDVCIIADNKKKYGIAAMPDRGMQTAPEDRSKSSIVAHQEKVGQDKSLAALGKSMTAREKRMHKGEEGE